MVKIIKLIDIFIFCVVELTRITVHYRFNYEKIQKTIINSLNCVRLCDYSIFICDKYYYARKDGEAS